MPGTWPCRHNGAPSPWLPPDLRSGAASGKPASRPKAGERSRSGRARSASQSPRCRRAVGAKASAPSRGRSLGGVGKTTNASYRVKMKVYGSPEFLAEMVGPTSESSQAHMARHGGGSGLRGDCPRCRWYVSGHTWMATYGSLQTELHKVGPRSRICWIQERPSAWGGAWALGCRFCADAKRNASGEEVPLQQRGVQVGKLGNAGSWARFEARPWYLHMGHLENHARTKKHKAVMRAFLCPAKPAVIRLEADASDDA